MLMNLEEERSLVRAGKWIECEENEGRCRKWPISERCFMHGQDRTRGQLDY